MEHATQTDATSDVRKADSAQESGLYAYCVGLAGQAGGLGEIGLDDREVFVVASGGLGAAVHQCPPQPYQPRDPGGVSSWVLAHHRVVDAAWRRWGTVVPLAFNTIIRGGEERDAQANLRAWLKAEEDSLTAKLHRFVGKAEYGVEVFWDPQALGQLLAEASPEIGKLKEEIETKPRGLAYMYRQKLEARLRAELEARAAAEYRDLYSRVCQWTDEVRVEKAKASQGQLRMLMKLSCLAPHEKALGLRRELDGLAARQGFSARLVGPLPPYSFC